MFGLQTPKFLLDLEGKPSTMRASAFIAVLGGVTILVSGAFGWATGTGALGVKAEHGLWLVGLGLVGKAAQRGTEAKQAMGDKPKDN